MKILKGILVWVSIAAFAILFAGIDNIFSLTGVLLLVVCTTLYILCRKVLAPGEFESLSLINWLTKKFPV